MLEKQKPGLFDYEDLLNKKILNAIEQVIASEGR